MAYGESSGGSEREIGATAELFNNLVKMFGMEGALKKSSAFNTKSPQYNIGATPEFRKSIDQALKKKGKRPFDHMENVDRFGNPPWIGDMRQFSTEGRQRFFTSKAAAPVAPPDYYLNPIGSEDYTIQPGDTLSEIAAKRGLRYGTIASDNNITNPNRLRVGQQLKINYRRP